MTTVNWKQQVFAGGKLVAAIDRQNVIGERRKHHLTSPLFERVTLVTEFVAPGVWRKVQLTN